MTLFAIERALLLCLVIAGKQVKRRDIDAALITLDRMAKLRRKREYAKDDQRFNDIMERF